MMKKFSLLILFFVISVGLFSMPVHITIYTPGGCWIIIDGDGDVGAGGIVTNFTGTVQIGGGSGCPKLKWHVTLRTSNGNNGADVIIEPNNENLCLADDLVFVAVHNGIGADELNFINFYSKTILQEFKNDLCQ